MRVRPVSERLSALLDHRDDEAPVERDGDADVDLLAVDDLVAAHRRVEHRDARAARRSTALMMNGRYVSFSPVAFSNSARFFARMRAMRVKSTSKNELTCADVWRDSDHVLG